MFRRMTQHEDISVRTGYKNKDSGLIVFLSDAIFAVFVHSVLILKRNESFRNWYITVGWINIVCLPFWQFQKLRPPTNMLPKTPKGREEGLEFWIFAGQPNCPVALNPNAFFCRSRCQPLCWSYFQYVPRLKKDEEPCFYAMRKESILVSFLKAQILDHPEYISVCW